MPSLIYTWCSVRHVDTEKSALYLEVGSPSSGQGHVCVDRSSLETGKFVMATEQ